MSAIPFYDGSAWRRLRREVMRDDNNECQICKARHKHTRGVIVHHIYHLEDYPQWGLMKYVIDPVTGAEVRNLITVCRECHETVCHPEKVWTTERKEPVTEERW